MGAQAPPTDKGRRTRERIVRAAAQLVADKGAREVTLDDVCELAPASRSQLYHYFHDRDELIRAVVQETAQAVLGGQAQMFEQLGSWEGIERWMDSLVQMQWERSGQGGCPLGTLAGQLAERDALARAAISAGLAQWEGHVAAGLLELRESGELRAEADPAALAKATLALIQGGLVLTQVHRDPLQLRAALDSALMLMRAGS